MKIYTEKQVAEIKNQALNKIYFALRELNAKDHYGSAINRHDELLDIALKHLNSKPTDNVYSWIKKGNLKGVFFN